MEYRTLNISEIPELIKLWNAALPHHPITMQQYSAVLLSDENYEPENVLAAVEQEKLIGFCIGIRRRYPFMEKGLQQGQGWILNIGVQKNRRRKGIGTQLLQRMEKRLGCQHLTLAAFSPYYFFAGVDETYQEAVCFFGKHGYERTASAYPMQIRLDTYEIPEEIRLRKRMKIEEGYTFDDFCWEDSAALLDFMKQHFSCGWRYHIQMAMRKHTALDTLLLCRYKGKIIGYVQCAIDGDLERYGPFGVAAQFRNRGIGSVMVHEMWRKMKENGAQRAWFHSTDEAGRRFYERHGMQVMHTLYHYEKEVQNENRNDRNE